MNTKYSGKYHSRPDTSKRGKGQCVSPKQIGEPHSTLTDENIMEKAGIGHQNVSFSHVSTYKISFCWLEHCLGMEWNGMEWNGNTVDNTRPLQQLDLLYKSIKEQEQLGRLGY